MTHKPCLIVLLSLALLLPVSAFADLGLGSGFHLTTFSGDDEKGTQMYLPISSSLSFGDLYLKAQTAYVKTTYDPGPGGNESLSTLTDTELNLSYGLLDKLPVDALSVTSQLQIKLNENWRLKHSLVNKKNPNRGYGKTFCNNTEFLLAKKQ